MKIGWEWWLLGSSVLVGLIFLVIILAIKKSQAQTNTGAWKTPFVFLWDNLSKPWKLIGWGLALGAGYGIYLIVISNLPTPEEKMFSELSKNLAEVELQPEKDKLANLNAKVKGGASLTEEEKRVATEATKKIGKVRKDYSEGKLVEEPPAPIKTSAPVVWDWTFEWEATPEQLQRNKKQEKGLINPARVVSLDAKVLKFNYKRPSGKLVELTLSRNDSVKEFYQGKVSQPDLYLRVWLLPDGEDFRGYADNGPNTTKMEVFLKKKL